MKNLSTLALATRISSTRLLAPRLVLVDFPTYLINKYYIQDQFTEDSESYMLK